MAALLYSGGLDSILACEVLKRAGVRVIPVRFESIFCPSGEQESYLPEEELVTEDVSAEMVELVKAPRYGLGKNVNPCMDCKQMMYARAWELGRERGADFLATGEVVGQRPMSQRREAFRKMESGAGLERMVLRPLCAKLLPLTIPEERGRVDREKLLDLHGRSRKPQIRLAERWGIEHYPSPAGGCRLTDPNYAQRIMTLMRLDMFSVETARLVQSGRLFALEGGFAVVGRDHEDNLDILDHAPDGTLLLELKERPGPLACLVGSGAQANVERVAELVVRYSRFEGLPPESVRRLGRDEMRREWSRRGLLGEP